MVTCKSWCRPIYRYVFRAHFPTVPRRESEPIWLGKKRIQQHIVLLNSWMKLIEVVVRAEDFDKRFRRQPFIQQSVETESSTDERILKKYS